MSDGNSPAAVKRAARQVIDRFTPLGLAFTALDISNAVKQSMAGVRHRHVSGAVRELFDEKKIGTDYTRSLIDVQAGNKKVQAYLYHPEGDDPQAVYGSIQRRQLAAVPMPSQNDGDDSDFDDDDDFSDDQDDMDDDDQDEDADDGAGVSSGDVVLSIDGSGELAVPTSLIRQAGIDTDDVRVNPTGNGPDLQISACPPGTETRAIVLNVGGNAVSLPSYLAKKFSGGAIVARVDGANVVVEGR